MGIDNRNMTVADDLEHCPCGSGRPYGCCCGLCHRGAAVPETAEQLMRSRYTAYVLIDQAYLIQTWHSTSRPSRLELDDSASIKWLGLKIKDTQGGQAGDVEGVVEFVARYRVGGKAVRLHERSRFVREAGRWWYVAGDVER